VAKTQKGKKIVTVKGHTRAKKGGVRKVREVKGHRRSTPK
jgi:ATP-dependent Lon protease